MKRVVIVGLMVSVWVGVAAIAVAGQTKDHCPDDTRESSDQKRRVVRIKKGAHLNTAQRAPQRNCKETQTNKRTSWVRENLDI